MKLLIVDDEKLTREGLISSLDWEALGILQIFQADDGLNALEVAHREKPDIILSDVRMPRLDGIQLVERLEEFLPDASVIFMSGYSDKKYLKAAIKLKAINYVEKPLNPEEIKDAVLEAAQQRQKKLRTRQNEKLYSMETASQLALFLTKPYSENPDAITALTSELSLRLMPSTSFTTYIVKLKASEIDQSALKILRTDFSDFLTHYHLCNFYIRVHANYHVFHIMSNTDPSPTALAAVESFFKEHFHSLGSYYIGRGETVTGIAKAYHSYTTAVVMLQSSFFFQPGTILSAADTLLQLSESGSKLEQADEIAGNFQDALLEKRQEACDSILQWLHTNYSENRVLMPNQIKDFYYKLFISINDSRQKLKLTMDYGDNDTKESIIEHLENCFSFEQLHTMLVQKTEQFFASITTYVPEDSTIFLIKDYISKYYSNDALSIKEISEHVFLSASYICTYFKNQTGQTLNQYLTEYRMEKAKQLLADARYQIADISSKVGYSNGNYFSKSFKKFTGMNPSKYRETTLK